MTFIDEVTDRLIAPARNKGVSQDNLPFVFLPDVSLPRSTNFQESGKSAVLLVHGFCATPWEMRLLGRHLAANGYCSLGVLLSGHGTTPEDLSDTNRSDWIDSIEEGYRILEDHFDRVYAVGLSTGALLILKSLQSIDFSVIVLLSPYLRLLHPLARHSCWLHYLLPFHKRDLSEEGRGHYYSRRPLKGVCELNRLIAEVELSLPQVNVPTICFSAEGDKTVDWRSGEDLFDKIGTIKKEFHLLGTDVPHVLTREENPYLLEMCGQIVSFFRSVEGETQVY